MFVKSLDTSNILCEYEVNGCLTKKVLEENETLTQIVNDTGRPPGRIHQSISRSVLKKILLKS